MRRPAAVADLLGRLLRGTPAEQRLKEGRIWLVWETAVGRRIASHAQPAAFRDGILTLRVDSSPWMQQLTYLKRDLISKVNAELGEDLVKDLFMKGGKVDAPAPAEEHRPAKRRELSDEERSWVEEQAVTISDPELRAVFESLIKKDRENKDRD
jgi:predicted nucleic acid-binding Zn ribbon protein